MSNLFNNANTPEPKGFQPVADNSPKKAKSSTFGKIFLYFTFIFIFPIIWYVLRKNKLNRMQNEVNKQSSNIDVQLQKRFDTLNKLAAQVKSYKELEKSTQQEIARLRNLTNAGAKNSIENSAEIENLNRSVFGRLIAVSESYPDLKASRLYEELMSESTYLERELEASRRLYNKVANDFNEQLFVYPTNVVASNMKLETMPLFVSDSKARQDVDMSNL
ncbi:LemA family protein [[Mycoplasma] falconis]|uniref:LemA family protein n=1 Tax=[Mycoplasma] falconis TaxID=92403 RepID=A0A501XB30_9BACT|nr:LemA family protein [[Mycoplasma] falconis]TPE57547.1 LemA family protein [[Mycoplasma] falconis]